MVAIKAGGQEWIGENAAKKRKKNISIGKVHMILYTHVRRVKCPQITIFAKLGNPTMSLAKYAWAYITHSVQGTELIKEKKKKDKKT